MSIGIFNLTPRKARVLCLALICTTTLSACVGSDSFAFAARGDAQADGDAKAGVVVPSTRSTTLARDAIKLDAPKGFCIDASSVSTGLQGSSAMLAKCDSLEGKGSGADTAVLTVQVSARRAKDAAAPNAKDITVAVAPRKTLKTLEQGTLVLAQVGSGGDEIFPPADPVHWRGATALDTRLVLLGLFAPKGSELTGDKGADLLTALARGLSANKSGLLGLLRGSAKDSADIQPESAQDVAASDTVEQDKKAGRGLIARLLNRP